MKTKVHALYYIQLPHGLPDGTGGFNWCGCQQACITNVPALYYRRVHEALSGNSPPYQAVKKSKRGGKLIMKLVKDDNGNTKKVITFT